jgi:hypothetical protein
VTGHQGTFSEPFSAGKIHAADRAPPRTRWQQTPNVSASAWFQPPYQSVGIALPQLLLHKLFNLGSRLPI